MFLTKRKKIQKKKKFVTFIIKLILLQFTFWIKTYVIYYLLLITFNEENDRERERASEREREREWQMTMRVDESEIQGPRRFPPPIALVCTVSIFQCRLQFTFDYLHPGLLEARSLALIWFQASGYSFAITFLIDFLVHLSQGPTQWPVSASGPIRWPPCRDRHRVPGPACRRSASSWTGGSPAWAPIPVPVGRAGRGSGGWRRPGIPAIHRQSAGSASTYWPECGQLQKK